MHSGQHTLRCKQRALWLAILLLLIATANSERVVVQYEPGAREQVLLALESQGWALAADIPEGNAIAVTRSVSASGSPRGRSGAVSDLPGVTSMQPDNKLYLLSSRQLGRGQLQAPLGSPTCKVLASNDVQLAANGQATEVWPLGITQVQAKDPVMKAAAAKVKDAVLFCLADTGVDARHPDLAGSIFKGCSPPKCAHTWNDDAYGHGTHIAGTIAAQLSGKGIVGVASAGARLYVQNLFGDGDSMDETSLAPAWDGCLAHLDTLKATNPAFKMVISMSLGGPVPSSSVIQAKVDAMHARGDVLFFAAAGNSGGPAMFYPAGYPNVISVGATDIDESLAGFSQRNDDVELVAPGVSIISTASSRDLMRTSIDAKQPLTTSPGGRPEPPAVLFGGSGIGKVTGRVVDCGTGALPCSGATGKICLVKRSNAMFCSQVRNCMAGGGVGAIIYNEGLPCLAIDEANLQYDGCGTAAYVPTVGVTNQQGEMMKAALDQGSKLSATLDGTPLPPFGFKSGTSMSTPHAAGVAGLVWASYPNCTNAEIRTALQASARPLSVDASSSGYGMVQARNAYDYLAANPCSGSISLATAPPSDRGEAPPTKPAPKPASKYSPKTRPPPPKRKPKPPPARKRKRWL